MQNDKFINLFTDFGFKKIFGEEPNKDILISFINELFQGKEVVKTLKYANVEKLGKTENERRAVYDLYCTNEKGEHFIVEIQRVKQEFFKDRSIYYSSFVIQEQAQKGDKWKYELKGVYTISVLDFIFEEENKDKIIHRIKLIDEETHEIFYTKLTYIYVEIPKFDKELSELTNDFERWLFAFKNLHKLQDKPAALQQGIFKRLMELAEISAMNKKQQQDYQKSLKDYWDLKGAMDTYLKDGIAIGIEQTAVNAINEGFDNQMIVKLTGLSIQRIQELRKNLKL